MRCALFCFCLLLLGESAFADSLVCNTGADDLTSTMSEGSGEVKSAAPLLDASLSPGSLFLALEDQTRHRRVAFTGSGLAISPDGALLESGTTRVSCHLVPDKLSFAPPPKAEQLDYLACAVDEAQFADGSPVSSERHLLKLTSPINSRLPFLVTQEDTAVAYAVRYSSTDPIHGLDVTLTDKATGEVSHYSGPARTMLKSFLMGLTIGERATSARFFRLGCVWTSDPNALKQ
jgi:hypothetical protein